MWREGEGGIGGPLISGCVEIYYEGKNLYCFCNFCNF